MFVSSAGLLALVASAAASTPTGVPSSAALLAQRQHLELTRMQLIDNRCHWLDATTRVALDATVAERLAWLRDKAPKLSHTPADVALNAKQANAVSCANSRDALAVRFGAWQMRVTWTLRAQSLLDGPGRPSWFAWQSPVLPYRKALDETLTTLSAKYGTSIETTLPGIAQEGEQMLARACPNKPRNCPVKTATDHGPHYAQTWVKQATKFAQALAADPVKLPSPPK